MINAGNSYQTTSSSIRTVTTERMATKQILSQSLHSVKDSEAAHDLICKPCEKEDRNLEAVGYCSDCDEYLCQECYDIHLKPTPSRDHVLQDVHMMAKNTSQRQTKEQQRITKATSHRENEDNCTEPCTEHQNETLKYYCRDHDQLGCGVCKWLFHSECKHVDYIPDIAGDVLTTDEYKDMKKIITYLMNTAQQAIRTTQNKKDRLNQETNAKEFCDQLRSDLTAAVDKLETRMIKVTGKIRDEILKEMKSVEQQYNQQHKCIESLYSKFTSLEDNGQLCQIFSLMKIKQNELVSLETSLQEMKDHSDYPEYVIKINEVLHSLIQQPEKMASLEISNIQQRSLSSKIAPDALVTQPKKSQDTTYQEQHLVKQTSEVEQLEQLEIPATVHVAEMGVRMEDDTVNPYITGSVVLPRDKLVLVDSYNSMVKLIDLQNNTIVSTLKYGFLWDITAVTDTQVALTSPEDNTILFINVVKKNVIFNVTYTLKYDHELSVDGKCHGIACVNDNLVITYINPVKVEIISRKGKLQQTVVTEDIGKQLFNEPEYVAISPDQQTLYISDRRRDTVTSLDLSGQVIATYKSEQQRRPFEETKLRGPRGLAVDRAGMVYVCGFSSNSIHQLTPDLDKIRLLLQHSDETSSPVSITYNEQKRKMYIAILVKEMIKVYLV